MHPTWIEINLEKFRENVTSIRKKIGTCKFCLPVKGNAYGHGIIEIGKAAESCDIDLLGVAHLKEAIQLREGGISLPIICLGSILPGQDELFHEYNIEASVSSIDKATMIKKHLRVHLEVDTGMRRTGVRPETLDRLMDAAKHLKIVSIYSHFANAYTPKHPENRKQIEACQAIKERYPDIPFHLANSAGVRHFPDSYFDMVRPGILTYRNVLSIHSTVSFFKVVKKGCGISYGHTYAPKEDTRIVTLPIGYGDGIPTSLSNKGHVEIRGQKYPIVGTICMDHLMVDIGPDGEAFVGDHATLPRVSEIAKQIKMSPYEILANLNARIDRKCL